jgi:hypothetical protein
MQSAPLRGVSAGVQASHMRCDEGIECCPDTREHTGPAIVLGVVHLRRDNQDESAATIRMREIRFFFHRGRQKNGPGFFFRDFVPKKTKTIFSWVSSFGNETDALSSRVFGDLVPE